MPCKTARSKEERRLEVVVPAENASGIAIQMHLAYSADTPSEADLEVPWAYACLQWDGA